MRVKRTIPIRVGDEFIHVEVNALDCKTPSAVVDMCMDGPTNFRATELCRKIAAERLRGTPWAVYVIGPENLPVCKIGIAESPHSRLIDLQNANWNKLVIHGLLWIDNFAYEVEQLALKAAKEMGIHIRGEWVAVEPREACELVLSAARYSGRVCCDSATWLDNWPIRMNAVAEAKGRAKAIGKLRPRTKNFRD